MPKNQIAPGKMTPSSVPADLENRGCTTSFLMGKRNEIDKVCERSQATQAGEYTQPDEEKEAGGEA
jgi:Zn-finger nucleic acid-binding protein